MLEQSMIVWGKYSRTRLDDVSGFEVVEDLGAAFDLLLHFKHGLLVEVGSEQRSSERLLLSLYKHISFATV